LLDMRSAHVNIVIRLPAGFMFPVLDSREIANSARNPCKYDQIDHANTQTFP
jgi:hypothetical protein